MAEPSSHPPVAQPITGELDLHHFRPDEITRLLDDYFAECLKRGLHRIRVVHGKGTGTLRQTVHHHLRRSALVASFASGDERSGSWGATWVTLAISPAAGKTAHPAPMPPVIPPLSSQGRGVNFPP